MIGQLGTLDGRTRDERERGAGWRAVREAWKLLCSCLLLLAWAQGSGSSSMQHDGARLISLLGVLCLADPGAFEVVCSRWDPLSLGMTDCQSNRSRAPANQPADVDDSKAKAGDDRCGLGSCSRGAETRLMFQRQKQQQKKKK